MTRDSIAQPAERGQLLTGSSGQSQPAERGQLCTGSSGQSVFTEAQPPEAGATSFWAQRQRKAVPSDEEEGLQDSEELKYAQVSGE